MSGATEPPAARPSGLREVIDAGLVSHERLPVLDIVFDRLVRTLSTSLRNLTSDNVEVTLASMSSLRFGTYMEDVPSPALMGVFSVEQWGGLALLVFDAPMIFSAVDVLLGGRQRTVADPAQGRVFTTIERSLLEKVARHILHDLAAAFEPICRVTFRYERTEPNPRFATVARAAGAVMAARLRIRLGENGGTVAIVLPHASLEPIRDVLLQGSMGERLGHDTVWQSHLADEVREMAVELDAVLGERVMSLSDVLALRVGSRVEFPVASDDPVVLRCGNVPLFLGSPGNRRNRFAVQIDEKLPAVPAPAGHDAPGRHQPAAPAGAGHEIHGATTA